MQQKYALPRAAQPANGRRPRVTHTAHHTPILPRKILQELVAQMID